MEAVVNIEFYTQEKPMVFQGEDCYVVEDLIIESCKYLGIGPLPRHLFGLYSPLYKIWFPLCSELRDIGKTWDLCLRLRYRLPSTKRLIEKGDARTFNYYFHQVRTDFLEGKIPELFKFRESALGLVATDIIRLMLEMKLTPDTMKYNCRDFFPQELKRSPLLDSFLQGPLEKAVTKGWQNSRQNSEFVKEKYLEQMLDLVPDYGSEVYSVRIDEGGRVHEVDVVVNPFHPIFPGLRIKIPGRKDGWSHVCSVEDLCYISIREEKRKLKNEKRIVIDHFVEISRKTGIPHYFQFETVPQLRSFVSVLDGYYRLMEKWTYNLCADLPSPALLHLRAIKCHGPVEPDFAYKKLQEKGKGDAGCYIIRESAMEYGEYYVDVLKKRNSVLEENIHTYKIITTDDDLFCLQGWSNRFPSIHELLSFHSEINNLNFKRCIPSSEYDVSDLLLCRKKDRDNNFVTRGDCNCTAQCIPHDAIVFSKTIPKFNGRFTSVTHGHLRRTCGESKAVAVKSLRRETKATHLMEFLSQVDKVLFWQHENIISTVGIILTNPTALVMEWLPLGPLDRYLLGQGKKMPEVDLIEAAYYVAKALWYLEEQQTVHGNIRCHNILVANHTDSSFKVKITDPGIISYSDSDIHWIPPECHDDYSIAANSLSADVYAFGTTLWEIFSFGQKPLSSKPPKEAKKFYKMGKRLPVPENGHPDIKKLMTECWLADQDSRKRPQSIVRDVNQVLYVVYNSRRTYEYATINDNAVVMSVEKEVELPPVPERRQIKEQTLSKKLNSFANIFKKQSPNPVKEVAYDTISQITLQTTVNGSSGQSSCPLIPKATIIDEEDFQIINNLDALYNNNEDTNPYVNEAIKNHTHWLIDRDELKFDEHLGQGFYGNVQKALFTRGPKSSWGEVAVKQIRYSEGFTMKDFQREINILKQLCHPNIVTIIGLVEDPDIMLVMEYIRSGNLLDYVKRLKDEVSHTQMLCFAVGIAEGMRYLESNNIVHRDLAARNVLVASEDHVKISDFGLAQITENHYYKLKTDRSLPLRWYAIESVLQGKFSHKSDVWSFGITLWEMFTHGSNAQIKDEEGKGIDDKDLGQYLAEGKRLEYPKNCPAQVYTLMKHCWMADSHARPSFSDILVTLETLKRELFWNDFDENGAYNPIK
ncbi:tyrosine-protein kinase JAK2 [Parasteatoda tepidariorum]|uniref:tyrosine-protein kinase JAK2 n=1 Tax=Parasteatoda tepidariorum TaxID=114398 RepID=UPI00077FA497|nr:tyrosine-protein kinase JAK2 [Parasteatoda tepidariorum]